MTDPELLQTLRRQQAELEQSLARLGRRLDELEAGARNGHELPTPLPAHAILPQMPEAVLPSLPTSATPPSEPPPVHPPMPPPPAPEAKALPPLPPVPRPSLEFQFGRWLTRIGAVFGIITLVLILSLTHAYLFTLLGPTGILSLSGTFCMAIVIGAQFLERRNPHLLFFARSILALGLAGLYVTLYAAHSFDSVRVLANPLAAGLLLLLWSVYVFFLAETKRSQSLALFSIALAYFSTSINPIGRFSMAADLLLAGAAVLFLVRHGWAALSYLSLLGTYFALLRRLVIDENGEIVLDTSHTLPFAPYAVYLIGAWVIFSAAVLLSTSASFRGAKRRAFLTLNNGALAGLLTLTTYIAGYGYKAMGWTLLWTGVTFLATSLIAGGRRPDPGFGEVTNAYFAQGLAAFTMGVMGVYTGVTRGVLLALETFFLGMTSTFARNEIVRVATYVTAFFATLFLVWEIRINGHHPWLLSGSGAVIMLTNAWWARGMSSIDQPRRQLMLSGFYYCALAVGLIAVAMFSELSDSALPPALAVVSIAFIFSLYLFPLYELPPVAQGLLIAAQALVLFPRETGEAMPWESTACVALLTLVAVAWWSRQRVTRYGSWVTELNLIYALALVGLAYHALRPYLSHQSWMIVASLLSAAFLSFGALIRVWPLAVMGQLFLAVAVWHFFLPDGNLTPFTWNGWAAAVPILVVYLTGRALLSWLRGYPDLPEPARLPLRLLGFGYHLLALAMLIRLIFGRVEESAQIGDFLYLGTFLLLWNTARARSFGVRCSFVLSATGLFLIARQLEVNPHAVVTFFNGSAIFFMLFQPTLLRHAPRRLVGKAESWMLILLTAGAGWLFVNAWVATRLHPNYLTMGWALYAVFLFFFGLLVWERRQRWCGLAILAAAMVRVLFADIWGFSNGYKVLTFVVLTLITLGIGFIYARFGERLKTWL